MDQQPSMDRLCDVFQSSARRWEMIVYPSIVAFIILAAYGFFLIYNLTKDVHTLAESVDKNMTYMNISLRQLSNDVNSISSSVKHMETLDHELKAVRINMEQMNRSMGGMNRNIYKIQKPLGVFGKFMP